MENALDVLPTLIMALDVLHVILTNVLFARIAHIN